jgi:hypothetical protein
MDDELSYVRVCLEDSSSYDIPLHKWDELLAAWKNWMEFPDTDVVFDGLDMSGGRYAFRLSSLQDMFESTPENRAEKSRLNKLLEEERLSVEGFKD